MPAVILKAGKAALAMLGNDHTRKAVGWTVTAILSPLILLVVLLIALLSGTTEHNILPQARKLCIGQRPSINAAGKDIFGG